MPKPSPGGPGCRKSQDGPSGPGRPRVPCGRGPTDEHPIHFTRVLRKVAQPRSAKAAERREVAVAIVARSSQPRQPSTLLSQTKRNIFSTNSLDQTCEGRKAAVPGQFSRRVPRDANCAGQTLSVPPNAVEMTLVQPPANPGSPGTVGRSSLSVFSPEVLPPRRRLQLQIEWYQFRNKLQDGCLSDFPVGFNVAILRRCTPSNANFSSHGPPEPGRTTRFCLLFPAGQTALQCYVLRVACEKRERAA